MLRRLNVYKGNPPGDIADAVARLAEVFLLLITPSSPRRGARGRGGKKSRFQMIATAGRVAPRHYDRK